MLIGDRVQGVVIGVLLRLEAGVPHVVFPGNLAETAIPARALAPLSRVDLGAEVALLFEDGDLSRPLVIGRIVKPAPDTRPHAAAEAATGPLDDPFGLRPPAPAAPEAAPGSPPDPAPPGTAPSGTAPPSTALPDTALVTDDGDTLRITATERIELRVGQSSIVLEKDGHITIRGRHLVSHASAANRIRGGSINLN